jgi:hypothetical protein
VLDMHLARMVIVVMLNLFFCDAATGRTVAAEWG